MRRLSLSLFLLIACEKGAAIPSPSSLVAAKVTVSAATGRLGTMGTRHEEAIYTDLTLRVDAPIRGSPGSTVSLTVLGGRIGERAMHVSSQPELEVGDEAIVFLDGTRLVEVLPIRDGLVSSADGRPLLAVKDGGLVFGRSPEQASGPAPVPLGSARGALLTPPAGPPLTAAQAVEALSR